MKISREVDFHLQYHQVNSKKNTLKTCEYVLAKFSSQFKNRDLASVSKEEVLDFLLRLTKDNKQATKRNRYSVLSSFYNFSINSALPALINPCNNTVIKKIFKCPQATQWRIVDKETVDEIIFRTTDRRNRLILELIFGKLQSAFTPFLSNSKQISRSTCSGISLSHCLLLMAMIAKGSLVIV